MAGNDVALADAALEDVEHKRHRKEPFKYLDFCLSKLQVWLLNATHLPLTQT